MAQTVIGVFDDASEAQTAVQELMEAGFSRSNIDLSTTDSSDADEVDSSYTTSTERKSDNGGGIGAFFSSLFGLDDDDDDNRRRRENYTTVGERHSVVTVHAMDSDEAERAADILDDAGAIDVDERAEQYRTGSYSGITGGGYSGTPSSTLDTGVTADPLAPVYGTTPSDSFQSEEQMDNRNRRSQIFDRSVDESTRMREDRERMWKNPMESTQTNSDREPIPTTGYNTTVDPERDVTNR